MPDPPASGCSCPLPEGDWGVGGWHFRRLTHADMALRFPERPPEWREAYLVRVQGSPAGWIATEPCAAYRAAVRRRVGEKRREEAQTARRRKSGGWAGDL